MASRECDTSDNGTELQNIRAVNHDYKNTSRPNTLKMDVKSAEVQKLILEHEESQFDVTDWTVMTKLKCLFVNCYERNSPISTMTGILNACKDGKSSEICKAISLKNNNTSVK
jgi:hypothetical protein